MSDELTHPMSMPFDLHSRVKVGVRLRDLRNEFGYTQTQVAAQLGISNSAQSQYEAGKRVPDFELLCKLAQLYDVSTDYLLGMTDFRLHFDDLESARHEIEGIHTIKNQAPELYDILIVLCKTLNDEKIKALTAILCAYVDFYRDKEDG